MSDRAIKDDVQNASLDDCKNIFENVDVKTYVRKDISGTRLGFIAQDIQTHAPPEFANLLGMQYGANEPLLSLDYSRLVCVLWGVVKVQETQIDDLIARVEALETATAKKTTVKKQLNLVIIVFTINHSSSINFFCRI